MNPTPIVLRMCHAARLWSVRQSDGLLDAHCRESGNWFLHSPRPGCSYSLPPVLTLFQFLRPVLLILAALSQYPAAAQTDAGAVKQVLVLGSGWICPRSGMWSWESGKPFARVGVSAGGVVCGAF